MRLEDNFMMALSNGQSYFGDMILLSKFVEKCSIVVEIGTARGLGTMVLSMHGAKVYTIDNYINFEMGVNKSPKYPETVDSLAIKIGNYLELFNSNIEAIKNDSLSACKIFDNKSIDLLFIDGDHTIEGIKSDFINWFPKVKSNGFILFHDYSSMYPHIMDFIDNKICKDIRLQLIDVDINYDTVIKIFKKL